MNLKTTLTLAWLVLCTSLLAQRDVSGTVTDDSGEPLIGATVIGTGTTIGTVTDLDGQFALSLPDDIESLTVSYTGYNTQTIPLGASSTVSITLDAGLNLNEVVVTGTGIATDRRRTAIAVETVGANELTSFPSGSIDQALVGKVPGAYFQQSSGQPGQQANIILRGINSLQGTTPMILIDGVQVLTDNTFNGSNNNLSSRLADIDFANVERVEVVQGAAAATIYGAQGANGVIQIFTKKGRAGEKAQISIGAQTSVGNALRGNFETASFHAYQTLPDGRLRNADGNPVTVDEFGVYSAPLLETGKRTLIDNRYEEPTFDRFDQIFRQFNSNRVNALITGGTENIGYAVSGAFTNQESAIFGRNNRLNLSSNVNFDVFRNVKVRLGVTLINGDNNSGTVSGTNDVTSPLGSIATTYPFIDFTTRVNGEYVPNPQGDNSANPLFEQEFRLRDNRVNRVNPNINISYSPLSWLNLDYKAGYDYYRDDYNEVIRNQDAILGSSNQNGLSPIQGRIRNFAREGSLINSIASAFLTFGDNDGFLSSSQLAFDYRRRDFNRIQTTGVGLPFYEPVRLSATSSPEVTEYYEEFATYGFLVNSKLEYKGMVGVSAGFRTDYASTFGRGSDPFFFPRADAYVRLSELPMWESARSFAPEFKLRAAYGEAGIQPGPLDRFQVLAAGQFGSAGYLAPPIALNNPDLQVQQSSEIEAGVDAVFQVNQNSGVLPYLRASFTYWNRTNEGIIRAIGVAPSTGAGTLLTNAITLDAQGIQASLSADLYTSNNFAWNFTTNFGRSTTKVADIQGGVDVPVDDNFILRAGEKLGTFRGQQIITSYEQLEQQLGEPADRNRYVQVPETGYIVDTMNFAPVFESDISVIGNGLPKFNMSFINDIRLFKGITLGAQVDWVYGFDIYNQTRQWGYRDYTAGDVDNLVTIGSETGAFLSYYNRLYNTNQKNSEFVEDGSFLRLRSVTLGANLTRFVQIDGVREVRLTLSGFNLATATNYTGFDPEAASNVNDPTRIGLDQYAFPNSRTYQVGLNLGF